MFSSRSSLPSVPRVPVRISSAGIVIEVPDGPSEVRDAQGEALPPYSLWHYIVELSRHLNSRRLRLMRFDEDRLQIEDEAGVARDAAVCALLRRWKHWGLKGPSFLR